jgi:hypothetical protein
MNCTCGYHIPDARVKLGFKDCVSCSSQEKYGFINIINHKTGNTIQVMPREQAENINKVGDRKRFGTILKGGSKNTNYNPKNIKIGCSVSFVGSKINFEESGKRVMNIFENDGKQKAFEQIEREMKNLNIDKHQASKLKQIISFL